MFNSISKKNILKFFNFERKSHKIRLFFKWKDWNVTPIKEKVLVFSNGCIYIDQLKYLSLLNYLLDYYI